MCHIQDFQSHNEFGHICVQCMVLFLQSQNMGFDSTSHARYEQIRTKTLVSIVEFCFVHLLQFEYECCFHWSCAKSNHIHYYENMKLQWFEQMSTCTTLISNKFWRRIKCFKGKKFGTCFKLNSFLKFNTRYNYINFYTLNFIMWINKRFSFLLVLFLHLFCSWLLVYLFIVRHEKVSFTRRYHRLTPCIDNFCCAGHLNKKIPFVLFLVFLLWIALNVDDNNQ
jgi:hypothetical protein